MFKLNCYVKLLIQFRSLLILLGLLLCRIILNMGVRVWKLVGVGVGRMIRVIFDIFLCF